MNFSTNALLAGLIFGAAGLYFLRVGKREANLKVLSLGLSLMLYPYFVENAFVLWGAGLVLTFFAYKSLD